MKKFILAIFLALTLSTTTFGAFALPTVSNLAEDFSDVKESHGNFEAIQYMKGEGVIKGYEDGTFKPNNKINRAEFLKIALESQEDFDIANAKSCLAKSNIKPLSDVSLKEWYAPYVCYGLQKGIIKGYPDGTFKAVNEIIFPEMAKIIANTQNLEIENSTITIGEWYEPFIKALEKKSAIPTSIGTIDHKVTRGEMTESLYRIKKEITNKASQSFEILKKASSVPADGTLGEVTSCAQLASIMEGSSEYSQQMFYKGRMNMLDGVADDMVVAPEATMDSVASESKGSGNDDYSSTNIQVAGVDEADIIKNDGKYIYIIKANSVRIVEAYPSENMKQVSSFTVDDKNFYPQEMFLNGDQLVIIGNAYREERPQPEPFMGEIPNRLWYPRYWGTNLTKVYIVDVSDHSNPKVERTISYEGNYSSSRRIGQVAYVIINKNPDYHILRDLELDAKEIVPQIEDSAFDNGESKPACGCGDIAYFPGYERPNYMIVSAIPLDDTTKKVTHEVTLGASENVYMSKKALYVATGAPSLDNGRMYWNYDNTQVYKFDLEELNINFNASNKVPGRILNQFSMDEFKDNFRIATTKEKVWEDNENKNNKSSNRLYVLNKDMKQVGAIEDIAPGERIYSVRFMGERAFMVTFKTVDPLFVIDLKDATNPKIVGQLKVPGWSDYLHPYDENHLIGFGKDVDESIDKDKVSEDTVYYTAIQGMKMSIFDVTDVENPKEMFKEVIGDRGTDSELLRNHKALLFDKEKNLLAFPITVQEKISSENLLCGKYTYSSCPSGCEKRCISSSCNASGICTTDCEGVGSCRKSDYEKFQTTFVGAYIYDIDLEKGFNRRGEIASVSKDELIKQGEYGYIPWEKQIQRIVYIAKNLYAISQSFVKVADMDTVKMLSEISLDEATNKCPEFIDCEPGNGATECVAPKGCEGITKIGL